MLLDVQQRFLEALLNPELNSNFSKNSLDIYRRNYKTFLSKALESIYPVTKQIVGDEFFSYMAQCYIQENNSNNFSLDEYGKSFGGFISSFKPCASVEYLSDTAKLELLIHECSLARDFVSFPYSELEKLPENCFSAVTFKLCQNLKLLHSSYPVDKIWSYNINLSEKSESLEIKKQNLYFVIYRVNYDVAINRLNKLEYLFLQELKKLKKLEDICANLIKNSKINEAEIVSMLPKFMQLGYINSFTY